jgi:hypothetical protein
LKAEHRALTLPHPEWARLRLTAPLPCRALAAKEKKDLLMMRKLSKEREDPLP